jgi:hypothetical protein
MSDSGNYGFDAGQQPASNAPAAGWYFAQGDPPGTERYWNGTSWEGTYRAVGGFSPSAPPGRPDTDEFPSAVAVLAWIITALKAIPLILGAIGLALLSSLRDEIEAETDFDINDITTVVFVVGGAIILIGFVLLIGQIRAVTKKNAGQAAIWAGILTVVDVLYLVVNLPGGDSSSIGLAIAILLVQGGLFAWMLKLRSTSQPSTF